MGNNETFKKGFVTAPERQASETGLRILQEGGNALEAMIAMASTIAVTYPHMNGIGGDAFWLVSEPGEAPWTIEAAGHTGHNVTPGFYRGMDKIPARGARAAATVAGTVGGWQAAFEKAKDWGGTQRLDNLLADAIGYAREGFQLGQHPADCLGQSWGDLSTLPGFVGLYGKDGRPALAGETLRNPILGKTLSRLVEEGLDSFYRGALARDISFDFADCGIPLDADDLASYRATIGEPLSLKIRGATLYNTAPPTQGLASLMILGLFERLGIQQANGFDHIHGLIEATKQAFMVRNRHLADPAAMTAAPQAFLDAEALDRRAEDIDRNKALPWPYELGDGDTIWMGVIDGEGRTVSFIQSLFWTFGSGVILPRTGVLWQNRASGFSLDPDHPNCLAPNKRPFHTLNPAMARFDDGRTMVYGTMGGDGQPQTQAAIFTRYGIFGEEIADAVSAPRWVLGKTWGHAETHDLTVEEDIGDGVIADLEKAGHVLHRAPPINSLMGHAGAIVRNSDGSLDGATDPRSDGAALGL